MSQDKQPHSTHQADSIMLTLVLILAVLGLLILFSASEYNGRVRFHDSAYYFKKQLFATALGLGAMYLVSSIDYHFFVRLAPAAYLLSMLLSTAVLLFGQEINGSKRWLNLGPLSFQPSEFAKVSVVLSLTWQIERSHKRTDGFWFMCRTMLTLLPIVGLVGSNNLSTAIIILGIGVILIFAASPRYIQFAALGGAGIGFIAIFLAAESYRLERLAIWREPEKYEKGFQTIQGLYAIGSGGLFGRGIGNSIQKLGFVPEAQNDMIFSIICEEMGLTGAIILILIFALLLWRLCVISMNCQELSGAMIASGDSGYSEYCRRYQYHSQHRNYSPLHQLRRYFHCISARGNGAGAECQSSEEQSSHQINRKRNQPCDHALGKHNKNCPFATKFTFD